MSDLQFATGVVQRPEPWQQLIRVIEASLDIRTEQDFVDWTSSDLQAVLPHGMIAAGWGLIDRDRVHIRRILSRDFPGQYIEGIVSPDGQVQSPLLLGWLRQRTPQLFEPENAPADLPPSWRRHFEAYGLVNALAHGFAESGTTAASYFNFSRIPTYLTARHARLLELLVPHMHAALVRVWSEQSTLADPRPMSSGLQVTARERQILELLRQGKSNAEISQALCISRNTVKSHLQGIFQELDANDRDQAVVKGIQLGLLSDRRRR